MRLQLQTWNGYNIQDGTNYSAWIPKGMLHSVSANPIYVDRAGDFSFFSTVVLQGNQFTFKISLLGTLHLGQQQIMGWFGINDPDSHSLVAYDLADSNRAWYLSGRPIRVVPEDETTMAVTLALDDPMWRVVTASTATKTVTATAQQDTITVRGNTPTKPIFVLTPTLARTGGYQYKRWIPVYNRAPRLLPNYPIEFTFGGLNTAALVNSTATSNQVAGVGITSTSTSFSVDTAVGGGLSTAGGMCYCAATGEQIAYSQISGGVLTVATNGRAWGGSTAAALADNAVLCQSKALKNGNDVDVFVDGTPIDRWFGTTTFYSTATLVWGNATYHPIQSGTLLTALSSSTASATLTLKKTTANLNFLKAMKAAVNPILLCESEALKFNPKTIDLTAYTMTGVSRAQKATTVAAHAAATSLYWIEHDVWLAYGNVQAVAPDVDDTKKPVLNLATSSNTSWVMLNYRDTTAARPGEWIPAVLQSASARADICSHVYTGNYSTGSTSMYADPATEMGIDVLAYMRNNVWKPETEIVAWRFHDPAGMTAVSYSAKRYLYSTASTWPALMGLQRSTDNITWVTVNTIAKSTATGWTASSTYAGTLGATYLNARFVVAGSISGIANNEVAVQFDTVVITKDSSLTPSGSLGAEQATYHVYTKITNITTSDPKNGEYIRISYPLKLNESLTVDCDAKTVTLSDGSPAQGALKLSSVRGGWLDLGYLTMGAANGSTVTLRYDDVEGLTPGSVTLGISWYDRML